MIFGKNVENIRTLREHVDNLILVDPEILCPFVERVQDVHSSVDNLSHEISLCSAFSVPISFKIYVINSPSFWMAENRRDYFLWLNKEFQDFDSEFAVK